MTNYMIFTQEYLYDKTLRIQPWIKEIFAIEFNGNMFKSAICNWNSLLFFFFFPLQIPLENTLLKD